MKRRFLLPYKPTNVGDKEQIRALQANIETLSEQLEATKIPITIGPGESLPAEMIIGQPVIDWSTGLSIYRVWNGQQLI